MLAKYNDDDDIPPPPLSLTYGGGSKQAACLHCTMTVSLCSYGINSMFCDHPSLLLYIVGYLGSVPVHFGDLENVHWWWISVEMFRGIETPAPVRIDAAIFSNQ